MKKLKISVITVVYNGEKTIERAIISVLSQNYDNSEYVIIDGASTDRTVEIVNKYKEHIAYFVSEPDNGIYDAMNKGIAKCLGDVIVFLGCDDYFLPGSFERINNVYKMNPDIKILCCDVVHIDKGQLVPIPRKKGAPSAEDLRYDGNQYPHQGVFARRELFDTYGGFNTEYKLVADYEWLLRIYNSGVPFVWESRAVAAYSLEGVSTINKMAVNIESRKIAQTAACLYEKNLMDEFGYKYTAKEIGNRINMKFFNICRGMGKDTYTEMVKNFLQSINMKKVIIMGCGVWGKECYLFLQQCGISIECFWDNFFQEKEFCGVSVFKPAFGRKTSDTIVLIAMLHAYKEVVAQLVGLGLIEDEDFCSAGTVFESIII